MAGACRASHEGASCRMARSAREAKEGGHRGTPSSSSSASAADLAVRAHDVAEQARHSHRRRVKRKVCGIVENPWCAALSRTLVGSALRTCHLKSTGGSPESGLKSREGSLGISSQGRRMCVTAPALPTEAGRRCGTFDLDVLAKMSACGLDIHATPSLGRPISSKLARFRLSVVRCAIFCAM